MAPEQAQGKALDGRADLYALGVILFEWLAGVRPLRLRGATLAEQAKDLMDRPAPALSDFKAGLAPGVVALVAQLLEKKPGRRPATAEEVARRCRELQSLAR